MINFRSEIKVSTTNNRLLHVGTCPLPQLKPLFSHKIRSIRKAQLHMVLTNLLTFDNISWAVSEISCNCVHIAICTKPIKSHNSCNNHQIKMAIRYDQLCMWLTILSFYNIRWTVSELLRSQTMYILQYAPIKVSRDIVFTINVTDRRGREGRDN